MCICVSSEIESLVPSVVCLVSFLRSFGSLDVILFFIFFSWRVLLTYNDFISVSGTSGNPDSGKKKILLLKGRSQEVSNVSLLFFLFPFYYSDQWCFQITLHLFC